MKINLAEMYVDEEIKKAVIDVLESGRYVKGQEAKNFEKEFAAFCNAKYGITTNSGTSALHIALAAIGIKLGDEVILPSHTFIATVSPIIHLGAKPIFAEIDVDTYTIDIEDVKNKITKKTKVIIPVHLYGHPCNMGPLIEIAGDHNIKIIEDACQAHGAEYKRKKVGSLGDIACFSFFPSKNMTVAGDGGMVVTNNEEYALKAASLRDQGRLPGKKYEHDFVGFNYRMSEILATIGRIQLKHLPEWIKKRRWIANLYNQLMEDTEFILPTEKEWAKHVYHLYVVRHKKRDELIDYLKKQGIGASIHYPIPVHKQPSILAYTDSTVLEKTEKIADEVISLPIHPQLKEEEIRYIVTHLKKWEDKQ